MKTESEFETYLAELENLLGNTQQARGSLLERVRARANANAEAEVAGRDYLPRNYRLEQEQQQRLSRGEDQLQEAKAKALQELQRRAALLRQKPASAPPFSPAVSFPTASEFRNPVVDARRVQLASEMTHRGQSLSMAPEMRSYLEGSERDNPPLGLEAPMFSPEDLLYMIPRGAVKLAMNGLRALDHKGGAALKNAYFNWRYPHHENVYNPGPSGALSMVRQRALPPPAPEVANGAGPMARSQREYFDQELPRLNKILEEIMAGPSSRKPTFNSLSPDGAWVDKTELLPFADGGAV